jgi:hypothetical protein
MVCVLIATHRNCVCFLFLTTPKTAMWVAETCLWLLCKKNYIHTLKCIRWSVWKPYTSFRIVSLCSPPKSELIVTQAKTSFQRCRSLAELHELCFERTCFDFPLLSVGSNYILICITNPVFSGNSVCLDLATTSSTRMCCRWVWIDRQRRSVCCCFCLWQPLAALGASCGADFCPQL